MTLLPAGGFLLATLSVLAGGYIIHDSPICRWWFSRSTGYVLYFRIIVTGLALVFILDVLLSVTAIRDALSLPTDLTPQHILFLVFPFALSLRMLTKFLVWLYSKQKPEWREELISRSLNEKGLDQYVYERISNGGMIMITLENQKVYAGWPIEAPNNEDNKWLRLVPQWSGYRNAEYEIQVQTDYSRVFDSSPSRQDYMLITVDKIVTVQPFDVEVFRKFNPESPNE